MTEAPKRIGTTYYGTQGIQLWHEWVEDGDNEGLCYVRADIADATTRALSAAINLLGDVTKTCDEGDGMSYVYADDNPTMSALRAAMAKAEEAK